MEQRSRNYYYEFFRNFDNYMEEDRRENKDGVEREELKAMSLESEEEG